MIFIITVCVGFSPYGSYVPVIVLGSYSGLTCSLVFGTKMGFS